jgi:hypothetical protein
VTSDDANFELLGERASVSARRARHEEHARILAMTPRERALLALRLGRTLEGYAASARAKP